MESKELKEIENLKKAIVRHESIIREMDKRIKKLMEMNRQQSTDLIMLKSKLSK